VVDLSAGRHLDTARRPRVSCIDATSSPQMLLRG